MTSPEPDWNRKVLLRADQVSACGSCLKEHAEEIKTTMSGSPSYLRAFDPFAGTGAFVMSMQETSSIRLTHAVEISPSAAATLR